jgi:hypothetical protein
MFKMRQLALSCELRLPPGLGSLGTESLFPVLVVSVFRFDKATSTTQAGWKLRPWIRDASKVFSLLMLIDAGVSEKDCTLLHIRIISTHNSGIFVHSTCDNVTTYALRS